MSFLKKIILQTVLAKPVKEIEAILEFNKVISKSEKLNSTHKTVYCISPYKTGTTYLSGSFNSLISKHEPYQYSTLKELDKNFDDFFIKRLNQLNLKLECSGFLSAYVNELSENEITKDLTYICLLRKPTDWVNSVINYWQTLNFLNFDYINKYFWIKKVGVNLVGFDKLSKDKKVEIIDKMIQFYFKYINDTKKLKSVHYIELNEIDQFLPRLSLLINEKPLEKKAWKRENKSRIFKYQNEVIDNKYYDLIREIKKNNV